MGTANRYYPLANDGALQHLRNLVDQERLHVVKQSSGKSLLTNL